MRHHSSNVCEMMHRYLDSEISQSCIQVVPSQGLYHSFVLNKDFSEA